MHIYDIIEKKRHGSALTGCEIDFFAKGYLDGHIPDYQAAALLMAICINGMTAEETSHLTSAIRNSGDVVDLSALGDTIADKHSSGGVGDKTTLIVAPIVAAAGGRVAKMSGRGLGHTGGTIDKLEAIPGFSSSMSHEAFRRQVKDIGIAVVGQSGNLAPLDKKLYALRDVTATVDSIPLIASSIMGKKLASGSETIVLDVKYGSGAFMKSREDASALAESLVSIGLAAGKRVSAFISNMDRPLGMCVGNTLEVTEAVGVLSGKGARDITELCLALSSEMLSLSLCIPSDEAEKVASDALYSGRALAKFKEWIAAQGGDTSFIDDPTRLGTAPHIRGIAAREDGYIAHMDAKRIGICAATLGAGRVLKDDVIDPLAGIVIVKKTGDSVRCGELIALLHTSDPARLDEAEEEYLGALTVSQDKVPTEPIIHRIIRK